MIPMGLMFGTRPWNNELHDAEPKRAKSMQKREECNWCNLSVVASLGGQAKWTGLHDSFGSHDLENKAYGTKKLHIPGSTTMTTSRFPGFWPQSC